MILHLRALQRPWSSLVRLRSLPKLSLRREWGLVLLKDGAILITFHPRVTSRHFKNLIELFSASPMRSKHRLQTYLAGFSKHSPPFAKLELLVSRVAGWRILAKTSSGYPLNQAPSSALGPIISHFLSAAIDSGWATLHDSEMLKGRKNSLASHLRNIALSLLCSPRIVPWTREWVYT